MRLRSFVAALLFAPAARVAETAAEAAHEGSGGLPQLDPGSYPSQIFWLVVFFALLYYLLTRRGLPRLSEILEARQDRIAADLDRAARLREEAEEALRRYEAMLAEAHERAYALRREAEERLTAEYAARQAAFDRELQARIGEAEKRIEEAVTKALAGLRDVAAELVQAAVERLASIRISSAEARKAVTQVTRESGR